MQPNPLLGVVFHWLGGLASGSFYVPYKGVRKWSWETFWLAGGMFSWLICPWIGAFLLSHDLLAVLKETPSHTFWMTYLMGVLWGLGGLTFGLTMRYLGMSLGMAVALGYCAAFGTLVPPIVKGEFADKLLNHSGTSAGGPIVLMGVVVCLVGIAIGGIAGLALIARMETPGDRDLIGEVRMAFNAWFARLSGHFSRKRESSGSAGMPFVVFQLMDSYVLSNFLFYFFLWLAAFVTMTQIYNFFEMVGDSVKNHIALSRVLTFHLFLTPLLIYDTLPVAVLLAVLVTFGVMTKNNEVIAFKACGVSVRRLGVPVLLMSGILSAALFAADYSWIPQANQIQDAIHNEIKGRPVQTYLHPGRKWVIHNSRIFYFRGFDANEKLMIEPYVYEIDPKTFRLVRQISANRARWQSNIKQWVWEQGTAFNICNGVDECNLQNFTVTSFPEITEVPDDFLIAAKQNQQMNYEELGQYVSYLQERGFDTVRLRVQYHKKFAVPVFALIMALISVPFGFLVGNRGAMAGIGVSIAIAMAYLGVDRLFEQMGNVNYLPASVAAWTPDALFALAGLYLLLRMRS